MGFRSQAPSGTVSMQMFFRSTRTIYWLIGSLATSVGLLILSYHLIFFLIKKRSPWVSEVVNTVVVTNRASVTLFKS